MKYSNETGYEQLKPEQVHIRQLPFVRQVVTPTGATLVFVHNPYATDSTVTNVTVRHQYTGGVWEQPIQLVGKEVYLGYAQMF